MTKAEFVTEIAKRNGTTKEKAGKIFESVFEILKEAVKNGNKITIPGFGTFKITTRKEHNGHNPKTGEPVLIPEMKKLKFSASPGMNQSLN